jgi:hypothetical protein
MPLTTHGFPAKTQAVIVVGHTNSIRSAGVMAA